MDKKEHLTSVNLLLRSCFSWSWLKRAVCILSSISCFSWFLVAFTASLSILISLVWCTEEELDNSRDLLFSFSWFSMAWSFCSKPAFFLEVINNIIIIKIMNGTSILTGGTEKCSVTKSFKTSSKEGQRRKLLVTGWNAISC